MKKILFGTIIGTMLLTYNAEAAPKHMEEDMMPPHEMMEGKGPHHMRRDGMHKMDREKMHEMREKHEEKLAKDLGLTDDQKEQVKKSREEGRKKIEPLMKEQKELHEKMREIREENMKEFENILTKEQKEKFEQIKKEMPKRGRVGEGYHKRDMDRK